MTLLVAAPPRKRTLTYQQRLFGHLLIGVSLLLRAELDRERATVAPSLPKIRAYIDWLEIEEQANSPRTRRDAHEQPL